MIETKRMKIEDIHINEDFKTFLPPLQPEEYENLANDIAFHGVLDPLILWNGYIVDGHNRYEILKALGVEEVDTKEIHFNKESDVMDWILSHQGARRNLTKSQMVAIGEKWKAVIAREAKERQRAAGGDKKSKEAKEKSLCRNLEKAIEPIHTDERIAEKFGIGKDTYRAMELVVKEGTDEQKKRMDKGGKGNAVSTIAKEIKEEKTKDQVRICVKCGETKPVKAFCKSQGHENICKDCHNIYQRECKQKNNLIDEETYNRIKVTGETEKYTRESLIKEIQFSVDGFIESIVAIFTEHTDIVANDLSIADEVKEYLDSKLLTIKEVWNNE